LTRVCGFDPFVLAETEVRKRIADLKLRGRSRARRKADLIALLQRHFITTNTTNSNPHP
jgi:hypothetical protein